MRRKEGAMDVAEALVDHVLQTRYEDLPRHVIRATKQHILHTLATIVGGSGTDGCRQVAELWRDMGGRHESNVLVYGYKVPAMSAAMANAVMAHALDFCCNDDRTGYKSTVVVMPVALALAQKRGGVSGREFLTTVCLGVELGIRVAQAIRPRPAHALSWIIGAYAAAAAAGRLLKLNREQMLDALGIAHCQVPIFGEDIMNLLHPRLNKRLLPGLAARNGAFAALLAQRGFPSGREAFQGPSGYFQSIHRQEGDLDELVADLGRRFEIDNVGPKSFPSCRVTHAPIEAALHLAHEYDLKPHEIESVSIYLCEQDLVAKLEAIPAYKDRERSPQGPLDAMFTIPWPVAVALVKRDVFIDDFQSRDRLRDPEVRRLLDRVVVQVDPGLGRFERVITPARVEVRTRSGQTLSHLVEYPKGHPSNPVTLEETVQVFRRSAAFAALPLSTVQVDSAVDMVLNLELQGDMNSLVQALISEKVEATVTTADPR
jgi:2-methylcitrate dehydratase PrpD